jgi:cytochrome P450
MSTPVAELDLPVVDEATLRDSNAPRVLDDLRRQHWLIRTPLGYLVPNHEDIVAILRDQRWHNAAALLLLMRGVTDERFDDDRPSILSTEGADHQRLRRLVGPAFTPKSADQLRPFMRSVLDELVDPIAGAGRAELVQDVCEPYPIPIICELLGAPREDWQLFSRWAVDLLSIFDTDMADKLDAIAAARNELQEYTEQLISRRRADPGEDLLSVLIAAEEEGDRLSMDELTSMANAVLVAGTDTTRNQLGIALALFAAHPDQWRLLAEQPELAAQAVEECMRYSGAVRGTGRFASTDIEYRDVLFPQGTLMITSLFGGNHDPSIWDDAARFDIRRERPAPQLTFGSGVHFCMGAFLARAELQEALPLLARRLPDLAIDGEVTWKPPTVAIWGPTRLPVTFTPTAAG